jgi:hypothetical protein
MSVGGWGSPYASGCACLVALGRGHGPPTEAARPMGTVASFLSSAAARGPPKRYIDTHTEQSKTPRHPQLVYLSSIRTGVRWGCPGYEPHVRSISTASCTTSRPYAREVLTRDCCCCTMQGRGLRVGHRAPALQHQQGRITESSHRCAIDQLTYTIRTRLSRIYAHSGCPSCLGRRGCLLKGVCACSRGQSSRERGRWPEHTSHTEAAGARDTVAYRCHTHTCAVYQSRA